MDDKANVIMKAAFPEITDEELKQLSPGIKKWATKHGAKMRQYKMVAECYESRLCGAGIRVGDKIVLYGAVINKEESTAPLCIEAMDHILRYYHAYNYILAYGNDPGDLDDLMMDTARCNDMGVADGGLGTVKFKIRFEKVTEAEYIKAREHHI